MISNIQIRYTHPDKATNRWLPSYCRPGARGRFLYVRERGIKRGILHKLQEFWCQVEVLVLYMKHYTINMSLYTCEFMRDSFITLCFKSQASIWSVAYHTAHSRWYDCASQNSMGTTTTVVSIQRITGLTITIASPITIIGLLARSVCLFFCMHVLHFLGV